MAAVVDPEASSIAAAAARLQRASQAALRLIAIDALGLGVGETLPKGDVYRERLGVGSGTVQSAFQTLAGVEALNTVSRGRLGRQIVGMRPERLWRLAELPSVRFEFPPRGPIEVRAMTEFATQTMAARQITAQMHHQAGASERIDRVRRGLADVAVVSAGVADALVPTDDPDLGRIRHPEGTYYAPGRLLVVGGGGRRVGYDPSSHDQARLTETEFPRAEGWEYVDVDFPRVPVAVLQGRIDVGIWHEMLTLIPPSLAGLEVRQPRKEPTRELLTASSAAVFLYSRARVELAAVCGDLAGPGYAERIAHLMSLPPDSPETLDLTWSM